MPNLGIQLHQLFINSFILQPIYNFINYSSIHSSFNQLTLSSSIHQFIHPSTNIQLHQLFINSFLRIFLLNHYLNNKIFLQSSFMHLFYLIKNVLVDSIVYLVPYQIKPYHISPPPTPKFMHKIFRNNAWHKLFKFRGEN